MEPGDGSEQAEPESGSEPAAAGSDGLTGERDPLLPEDQGERFTGCWLEIQTGFVDEPASPSRKPMRLSPS